MIAIIEKNEVPSLLHPFKSYGGSIILKIGYVTLTTPPSGSSGSFIIHCIVVAVAYLTEQKTKCLASAIQKSWRGSQNLKSIHMNLISDHAPLLILKH